MLRKDVTLSIYRRRYNKLFKYVTTAKSAVSTGRQKAPPFNRTLQGARLILFFIKQCAKVHVFTF
jgi:hypothetical protein